jgi:low affinity Fe/Cu permease
MLGFYAETMTEWSHRDSSGRDGRSFWRNRNPVRAVQARNMSNHHNEKSAIERIGCQVSSWVSDLAANPMAQIAVVVICSAWFALGLKPDILTAVLSILAISLTQMVLNRQNEREAEAHRRDVAMHAKLDELVLASRRARDEMAGIEDLEEDEIENLTQDAKEAIPGGDDGTATPAER